MLFRRIAIRNFRKHLSPIVIENLEEGVTVIAGDNEEGKSTVLDAIRTGLFERHGVTGKTAQAMQPFGSSVRPEVSIAFEIDGKNYTISKGFVQKASARLTTPDGTYDGADAEERLADLLTFRLSERGGSKPDDQGILGLFWLEQGRIADGLGMGETGRSTLRGSLEGEVGDVLGGTRGRKLLDSARSLRNALLTPQNKPRGDLSAAIKEADDASARVKELEADRKVYDQEIDQLASVRRDLAQISQNKVIENAQDALKKADEEAKEIEALKQQIELAHEVHNVARAKLENASDRWSRRQSLIAMAANSKQASIKASEHLDLAKKESEEFSQRLESAKADMTAGTEAREAAESQVALAQKHSRLKTVNKELGEIQRKLADIEKWTQQRTTAEERLAEITVDQSTYEELQDLETNIREVRAALGAVATRVTFSPLENQRVKQSGKAVPHDEQFSITQGTSFELDGFGNVHIEPGATDLEERRAHVAVAEKALEKAFAALQIPDIGTAKSELDDRVRLEGEAKEAERLIHAYAPDGIESLLDESRKLTAERELLSKGVEEQKPDDVFDLERATRALNNARADETNARAVLDAAQNEHQAHSNNLSVAERDAAAANQAAKDATKALEKAQTEISDADLAAELENAKSAQRKAAEAKTNAENKLGAANPEEIELRRERAQSTLANVEAELQKLRNEQIRLETQLTAHGKAGLGEQLEEAQGIEAQLVARRDRLQRDADAWDLLVSTLTDAERDAKEAFLEPVLRRVHPFLRLLLPDAKVTLDEETLEITGVVRDGRKEPFDSLSVGTREQLSILVRLAFAVYLREKNYPAAVILDDALVYADDDRFERMQLALRKAAETVQILILTCRARDWREFGAPVRRLSEGKNQNFEVA